MLLLTLASLHSRKPNRYESLFELYRVARIELHLFTAFTGALPIAHERWSDTGGRHSLDTIAQ
jgi:hypothetical protein